MYRVHNTKLSQPDNAISWGQWWECVEFSTVLPQKVTTFFISAGHLYYSRFISRRLHQLTHQGCLKNGAVVISRRFLKAVCR